MIAARTLFILLAALTLNNRALSQSQPTDNGRVVTWRQLIRNTASDQRQIWLFPVKGVRQRQLVPTLAVLSATAALIATDSRTGASFRRTSTFHGFNSVFTGKATSLGIALAPASLYVAGLARRDSYAQRTALLAGEAVADAEILTFVMKNIDRRRRPSSYAPSADFRDSCFNSQGNRLGGHGSFPSGHAIAAFSVATVLSRSYPRHRWVPYVAYGLAGLAGFSRITSSAHFASDVFAGAALGYSISRFVVLRQ